MLKVGEYGEVIDVSEVVVGGDEVFKFGFEDVEEFLVEDSVYVFLFLFDLESVEFGVVFEDKGGFVGFGFCFLFVGFVEGDFIKCYGY